MERQRAGRPGLWGLGQARNLPRKEFWQIRPRDKIEGLKTFL